MDLTKQSQLPFQNPFLKPAEMAEFEEHLNIHEELYCEYDHTKNQARIQAIRGFEAQDLSSSLESLEEEIHKMEAEGCPTTEEIILHKNLRLKKEPFHNSPNA